jgi:hypothetical protein
VSDEQACKPVSKTGANAAEVAEVTNCRLVVNLSTRIENTVHAWHSLVSQNDLYRMRLWRPLVDFAQTRSKITNRSSRVVDGVIQQNTLETPLLAAISEHYCLKVSVNTGVP